MSPRYFRPPPGLTGGPPHHLRGAPPPWNRGFRPPSFEPRFSPRCMPRRHPMVPRGPPSRYRLPGKLCLLNDVQAMASQRLPEVWIKLSEHCVPKELLQFIELF